MSIGENIALDVTDLPTDAFDIAGSPDWQHPDRQHPRRNYQERAAASLTSDHGIDDRAAPAAAPPATHPLLDGF